VTSKRIFFSCGDLRLEGELSLPEGKTPFPAVVICHPHPLYGGNMDNNVVTAVCSALDKESIATLRFNFRGVGNSGGKYSEGLGEQDDVKAALDFVLKLPEIDNKRTGLAGYSFGGLMALSVAIEESRVKQLALISPALKEKGWTQFKEYKMPKLVLVGDVDEMVTFRSYQHLFGDSKQYQIVAGADHFWAGYEMEISNKLARFFHEGFLKR
jgi:alpha/beta superfamily hydrolase